MTFTGTAAACGDSSHIVPGYLQSWLVQGSVRALLVYTVSLCLMIFIILEVWRPCFFLTDDNLSFSYPILTEMGRHLQRGEWPFVSDYLFGGNYDWSRDVGCPFWHPFYLLPALLADSCFQHEIVDFIALFYLLLTTIGFTLLVHRLRDDFSLDLPDALAVFYTMSFVFSMYILTIGSSWLFFLGNQSALPWLAFGILDRKLTRGVILVALFSIHQFIGSFAAMSISSSLFLSIFALGVAGATRSIRPLFIWSAGTLIALLLVSPLLLHLLDGFAHSARLMSTTVQSSSALNVPGPLVLFSFFFGSWAEPIAKLAGDSALASLTFPFVETLLACAASWCILPALFNSRPWRGMEVLCLGLVAITGLFVIRPYWLAVAMHQVPILRSMRWPLREIMQLLFFFHLFIVLRRPRNTVSKWWLVPLFSAALFLLPFPFIRPPTLNPLAADREATLSGKADRFWMNVKTRLGPTGQVATVIDWRQWQANGYTAPYTYAGTANFPALYQLHSISGYSTTAPLDQLPLKTTPSFWFGAFDPGQVDAILRQRPDLKLIILQSIRPLTIVLRAKGQPDVDLSPYLPHDE